MEPVTVGIMAALALFFVIVSLTAFRMLTKETNFEDVYGENAMRLFAEEKSGKQKTSKANKNRAKNIDRKRDNMDKEQKRAEKEQKHAEKEQKHAEKEQKYHEKKIEESVTEMVEPSEAIDGTENGKKTEAVPMHEAKHPRKKNKNKHQTEGPKVTEAVQAEKGGEAPVDLDNIEMSASWTEKIEMVVESTAVEEVPAAEGTEKKAKKKRARRAEDHPREAPKEVMESCASEPKLEDMPALMSTKEEKKTERPKSKRATVSLHDMTADKLHTRLSAVEGLEPEYLSFLAAYFSETGALKAKLSEENATLRKQIGEKERLVLQCTEKLSAAQKKDAEIAHLQQSLTEEKKKYSLFEQSVCTQLSASVKDKNYLQHINEQLKAETAGLKEELKKAQSAIKALPPPVDTTAFQQQADMLRSELSATKKKASQLESELSQRTQTLQQMKSDLQNRELQMEHMKQAGALSEKRFKDAEAASKMEREFLEAKLNETLKAMDELQTLAATAREEAQQRAVSVQSAVEDCRSEFTQQVVSLKHQLANVEKERDILKKENESSLESLSQKDAQHTKEVTKLSDEISQLKQLVEAEKSKESRVSDELDKRSNELAQLYKQVDDLRKQYERECVELSTFKDKLAKAEKASETERIKITTLEKELAEAKAQLNVKESTKDAELKCAHCAARIVIGDLSSATAAVCDVRSSCRPGDVISAPSPEVVITSLPRKSSIPKNSGDEKLDPTAKPSICSHSEEVRIQSNASESNVTSGTEDASVMSFTTEVRRVLPPQKDFSAVGLPLTEGGSEEEDVDWRATHLHADSLMCFELKWPVPDWNAADAPKEVRISGSFWGWQQPRAMNRSEDGYSIQLEMPLEHEDHHGVGEERMTNGATTLKYTRSDPGRRSPIRQKMQYHEFKFLVDGQWRCADHYEKKRTEDGAFENNVVYF